MESVPEIFKKKMEGLKVYPPYATELLIEEYFYNYFIKHNLNLNRIYLPILWTSLYLSRKSGRNIDDLKLFIKNLDTKKKYFTIVQHCRGILCDVSHLDLLIISTGTGRNYNTNHFKTREIVKINKNNIADIPIPLLGNPSLKYNNIKKDILCSFVGNLDNHKELRYKMYENLHNKKNFLLEKGQYNAKGSFKHYYNILCRSKFSLCPRGVGISSFRLYESLQCLAIPIYIYDDVAWLPYKEKINWQEIAIIIHESEIHKIYEIINNFSEEKIIIYQNRIKLLLDDYFTIKGLSNYIKDFLYR